VSRVCVNNSARDCCPSWSADGATIYFISDRAGTNDVYAMTIDGATVRKVADGKIVTRPNVSPDDRYFAYARAEASVSGIYIYDRQSGTERMVISSR
jgi:TolB protein